MRENRTYGSGGQGSGDRLLTLIRRPLCRVFYTPGSYRLIYAHSVLVIAAGCEHRRAGR